MLENLQEGLWMISGGHLGEHQGWNGSRGHRWRCGVLKQCVLCEGFEAPLLLIAQVEKHLLLGLVEAGKRFYDLTEWGGFHGSI